MITLKATEKHSEYLESIADPADFFAAIEPTDDEYTRIRNLAVVLPAVTYVLRWAGSDKARLAIVGKLLGMDQRPQSEIARDANISETRISRAIKAGADFLQVSRKTLEMKIVE